MEFLIFIVLIVIVGSALWSMIEAAVFSVSLSDANIFKEQKKIGATSLIKVKEKQHQAITTIVVFNNIFNIVGSMMVGLIAVDVFGSSLIGIFSAVFTLAIIIFSEIIPKAVGALYSKQIALYSSGPLLFLIKVLTPFIYITDFLTRPFELKKKIVSEEEIKILSCLGHKEGSIETDEKEMIQKVFNLNDLSAKNIMTPRTMVEALEGEKTIKEIEKDLLESTKYSRIPVYNGDLDNIIGVCHQRDLLIGLSKQQKNKKVKDFIRKELFLTVPETMKIDKLIPIFQNKKTHLAIVEDGFGGTAGIVTLEDVLEQIVGEIMDETDEEPDLRVKAVNIKRKQKNEAKKKKA